MATGRGPALKGDEFAASIARLGPFEAKPHLAVACSGGPDSMALTFLANDWARRHGGAVTALIVDHALRTESAEEAERVREWLTATGIRAIVLRREGARPGSDLQAAAREARYRLLRDWCRDNGVLHLLLGHHQEDQAETLLLRLARGSGVDGLSAMAPLRETPEIRLLRPLLEVPRQRLTAYLQEEQRPFVRDPSNEDRSFARVRMREMLPRLGEEGMTPARLAQTARRLSRAAAALDQAGSALLADAVSVFPEGYALLRREAFLDAPEEVALRCLSRALCCVGGNAYGPRLERLERLYEWLCGAMAPGSGRTLAGCRVLNRRDGILLCREEAAMQQDIELRDGVVWDNRFRLSMPGRPPSRDLRIGALGRKGWSVLLAEWPALKKSRLPAPVRWALPAVRALDELVAVPHLNYRRDGDRIWRAKQVGFWFQPALTLTKSVAFARIGFTGE